MWNRESFTGAREGLKGRGVARGGLQRPWGRVSRIGTNMEQDLTRPAAVYAGRGQSGRYEAKAV